MPEGAVAVADFQTAGRGRLGPDVGGAARLGLLASVLLKPPAGRPLPQLALVAGVAVADALEELTGLAVQIKWPNDVMLRRTKVAGILAEARDGAVVLGIGVNVNQTREQLPERGGSLRTATGPRVGPRRRARRGARRARRPVRASGVAGGLDAVYDGLGARDFLRGRTVTVEGTSGVAEMIDRDGRLRIAIGRGEHVTVESGEVTYER